MKFPGRTRIFDDGEGGELTFYDEDDIDAWKLWWINQIENYDDIEAEQNTATYIHRMTRAETIMEMLDDRIDAKDERAERLCNKIPTKKVKE